MPRFLALDVDTPGFYVVAATVQGSAVTVEHALSWADDAHPLSPATAAAHGAKLKELLREAKVKPAPLLFVVGRDRVVLKEVSYPDAGPAEEPALVRFQAQRDLTESPDEVIMDYRPLPGAGADGSKRAQAVFVRRDVVEAARKLCEAAGLKLAGVTPRPFAVAAALNLAHPGATAAVTVGERGGEFTVAKGGDVLFARGIAPASAAGETALAAELKRNLAVYRGQPNALPLDAIHFAEAPDGPNPWALRLADALPLPVHSFDPLAGEAGAALVPAAQRGRFAGAAGVLASRAAGLPINFVSQRQPRAERGAGRRRALLAGVAGAAVVAVLALLIFFQFSRVNGQLADLQAEKLQLEADLERLSLDAKRLEQLDLFENRQVVVLDEFYDFSERMPDVAKLSVTEIDISALPPPKVQPKPVPAPGTPATASTPAPVVAAKGPPPPVAVFKVTMRTADPNMAQRAADSFKNDKYYSNLSKITQGDAGGSRATGGTQYIWAVQLGHRPPQEYTRQLRVTPPKRPAGGSGDEDEVSGITGGFSP